MLVLFPSARKQEVAKHAEKHGYCIEPESANLISLTGHQVVSE